MCASQPLRLRLMSGRCFFFFFIHTDCTVILWMVQLQFLHFVVLDSCCFVLLLQQLLDCKLQKTDKKDHLCTMVEYFVSPCRDDSEVTLIVSLCWCQLLWGQSYSCRHTKTVVPRKDRPSQHFLFLSLFVCVCVHPQYVHTHTEYA